MAEFRFATPNYDYSGIAALGQGLANYAGGIANQRALSDFNGDWKAAAEKLMRMGRIDDAVKLYSAGALADYRNAQTQFAPQKAMPDDLQMLEWAQKNGYLSPSGPSRLGPVDPIATGVDQADAEAAGTATPSGTPGISIQPNSNMPSVLATKLMSPQELEKQKKLGELGAQREGSRQGLKEAGPAAQAILNEFGNVVNKADPDTFQNALGPWQGTTPDPTSWKDAVTSAGAQTLGSVTNYLDQGMKNGFVDWKTGNIKSPEDVGGGFTSTLRDKVKATQANLINLLQRVQRVVGIGSQSDKELQQIIDQVGNLGASKTQADFNDRLSTVVAGLKAQGIPVEIPEGMQRIPGKTTDRFINPNEGTMQGNVAPSSAPAASAPNAIGVNTFSVDPSTGALTPTIPANAAPPLDVPPVPGATNGPVIQGPGAAPPTPPARALNALKAFRKNPQAIIEFDKIYGPGAAEFYLTRGR